MILFAEPQNRMGHEISQCGWPARRIVKKWNYMRKKVLFIGISAGADGGGLMCVYVFIIYTI